MGNMSIETPTIDDVLDVSGAALSTEAVLIDVEQFGELEITIARPTGFALSRLLRALEALGAELIASELADEENRDAVRSGVRLYVASAHASLLKIKINFKISKEQAPRLREEKKTEAWHRHPLVVGLLLLLAQQGCAIVSAPSELPPAPTCSTVIVEAAGRTLQDAAREAQEILMTASSGTGEPIEARIVWQPAILPPEQRRRE